MPSLAYPQYFLRYRYTNLYFGLKKHRPETNNILFIDASSAFEKVKTQNVLLPEHLDAIVSTYRNRETKDKYSYVATLDEVRENDYNLNIPRYVDTFEEEAVDLQAVSQQLKEVAKALEATDAEIKIYCDELGIETPF